jgi:shikimate 5-dehydrogenase
MHELTPAREPTMYFIGVTTGKSSINRIFPLWADRLGLRGCRLVGLDFPLHDKPENYRAVIDFIKRDPNSRGALITTHKIDLYRACRDQFDVIEPLSATLGEISSVYKRDGALHGRAADPWAEASALDEFLPPDHWSRGGEALILGAGGAGTALVWHLARQQHGANRPSALHVADRSRERLEHQERLYSTWSDTPPLRMHPVTGARDADALVAALPPTSLVVNATGMGKDTPGSPVTDAVCFPERGYIWEFNYRGELVFLRQAKAQRQERSLHVEDGWTCFLHGWTRVIGDVFGLEIPTRGPLFDELGRIASEHR